MTNDSFDEMAQKHYELNEKEGIILKISNRLRHHILLGPPIIKFVHIVISLCGGIFPLQKKRTNSFGRTELIIKKLETNLYNLHHN